MATRNQLVAELRSRGYDGPVSYAKNKLEQLLADRVRETTPKHAPPAPVRPQVLVLTEWQGLKRGSRVKIVGERGTVYEFISYTSGPHPYVTLLGGRRGDKKMRYIRPAKIQHAKNRKFVVHDEA